MADTSGREPLGEDFRATLAREDGIQDRKAGHARNVADNVMDLVQKGSSRRRSHPRCALESHAPHQARPARVAV